MRSTAGDNLREDFSWLPELLIALASNPLWALALGGILSMLVWRSRDPAKPRSDCSHRTTTDAIVNHYNPEAEKLVPILHEIQLLAPPKVFSAVSEAAELCRNWTRMELPLEPSLREHLERAIKEMKSDVDGRTP